MSSDASGVFREAIAQQKSIYFIGAKSDEIQKAVEQIENVFPSLVIAGFRHGYFDDEAQRASVIKTIAALQPGYVICGMGTPLQEQFLVDLRDAGWKGNGFTCGGFFHQSAQRLEYYPVWIDRFQLRWLYRIFKEPKLLKRYSWDYPKFVAVFCADYLVWRRGDSVK